MPSPYPSILSALNRFAPLVMLFAGLLGCTEIPDPQPPQPPPLWLGYGVVNHWFRLDPDKFAKLLQDNGLNITQIEYVPWFDDDGKEGLSTRTDIEAAKKFVSAMRKRSITTLITVVNWNGEAQQKADDQWFIDRVKEIRDQIGAQLVILESVSEPDGDKAHRWMKLAKGLWSGASAGNGDGGRGTPALEGYDLIDWHWCKDFTADNVKPKPYLNNTDCRPVLNPGPKRAANMARIAVEKNAHFLVYDWDGKAADEAVIKAIGEQLPRRED